MRFDGMRLLHFARSKQTCFSLDAAALHGMHDETGLFGWGRMDLQLYRYVINSYYINSYQINSYYINSYYINSYYINSYCY